MATARVHCQVRSGPAVSRSNGAAQCAIVRSIRTRTTSHDLDARSKKPKHARAKSVKRSKNQTNPEKPPAQTREIQPKAEQAQAQPSPTGGAGEQARSSRWPRDAAAGRHLWRCPRDFLRVGLDRAYSSPGSPRISYDFLGFLDF